MKKFLSLLLAFAIAFPPGRVYSESETSASSPAPAAEETMSLEHLALPKSLGKIEARYQGTGSRWVVQIQDVHAHFAAQENISAIVEHLSVIYGIKTFALEGGWYSTSFKKSWGIPSSREKQLLARTLMEDAYLTGPGYAALFTPQPIELVGIEDPKMYEENRATYLKHLSERAAILEKLGAVEKELSAEKQSVFNADLQKFDTAYENFLSGKHAEDFMPALLAAAESKGADFTDLDQVLLFKKILGVESSIIKEKLEEEGGRLMTAFKQTRLSFEELLKSGRIPADKLEKYPEALKYLEGMKLQDQMQHGTFFTQIDQLVSRVKEKLAVTPEEKELSERSARFAIAKKLLGFEATPSDVEKYAANQAAIDSEMEEAGLGEALKLSLEFYETAKKRDSVFFEKITDSKFQGNIAVVTGGFHTEGLSEQLQKAGISYVVITPDLAKESPDQELYFKRLQAGPKMNPALSQTLSPYDAFLESGFDGAFALGVKDLTSKEETSVRKVADGIEGGSAAKSSGRKISAAGGLSVDAIAKMSDAEVLAQLKAAAVAMQSAKPGEKAIAVISRLKDFQSLLKDPFNKTTFDEGFKTNRANAALILVDTSADSDTDMMGGRARIDFIPGSFSPNDYVEQPLVKAKLTKTYQDRFGIIAPQDYETKLLSVPPVRGALLALAWVLRDEIAMSASGAANLEFFNRIASILADFESLQKLQQSA